MSLRNRLAVPAIILSLAFLAGCGSSSNKAVTPPGGGFTFADLSGTYVFSTAGSDTSSVFIAIAGTFTACGCSQGTISSGTIDVNDPNLGTLVAEPVTGGRYSVGVDGRPASNSGTLTLQTAAATFNFDFVLTSAQHGLMTLYDNQYGTGSGTLDLASTVAQTSIDAQSFAFNLSGVGSFNTTTFAQTSFATVGAFTLDSNGAIGVTTTGLQDFNDNGITLCNTVTGCQITAGSVSFATMPGTATLTTSAGTFNFDVYPISATHWKMIETDLEPVIVGDVFTESTSIPTGNNVFTIAGFDSALQAPFTAAGIIDTDGNGNIKSDSVEDINDAFSPSEITGTIGGTYTALSGGRSLLTFTTGFDNGQGGAACSNCQFAAYPSSGGLQLLEVDNAGVTAGVAYLQGSNPTLTSSTGYGMNLAGVNSVEEDDIAEFINSGGAFAGLIDFNDGGVTHFAQKFSSSYSPDSTVTGRGTVTPGNNAFHLTTYGIDSTTTVFVETDTNQLGLGSFESQGSNTPGAAIRHLTVMRLLPSAKNKLRKR